MTCGRVCSRVWLAVWLSLAAAGPVTTPRDKLLFIVIDGVRWDYVDMQEASMLPGFNRILKEGVRAKWMEPLFPTLSYPTWTTLYTGRYAEVHNVVGNFYYDAATGEKFFSPKWDKPWSSEPIWITAEKAGLHTAQMMITGCSVPVQGVKSSFCREARPPFLSFKNSTEMAVKKFEEGFDFVQVFAQDADNTGHRSIEKKANVNKVMRRLDGTIKDFLSALEKRGLLDHVNIVIVSDHGMTSTAPGKVKKHEIDDYLDTDLVENLAGFGSFINIKVKPGKVDKVFAHLSKMPGVKVYKHDDIPERYHYKNSPFIHEIILVADKGHYVIGSRSKKQIPRRSTVVDHGNHGYDPNVQDMKGIFFAMGPAFVRGKVVEPVYIVDVYQVMTHVLKLKALPNNGTFAHVESIFKRDDKGRIYGSSDYGNP